MARLSKFLGSHNFQESLTLQRCAGVVKTIAISMIIPEQFVEHFHGAAWLRNDSFTAQNYPGSPPEYLRSDMLEALWKLAGEEDAKA